MNCKSKNLRESHLCKTRVGQTIFVDLPARAASPREDDFFGRVVAFDGLGNPRNLRKLACKLYPWPIACCINF